MKSPLSTPDPELEEIRAIVPLMLGPNPTIEECIRLRHLLAELAELSEVIKRPTWRS